MSRDASAHPTTFCARPLVRCELRPEVDRPRLFRALLSGRWTRARLRPAEPGATRRQILPAKAIAHPLPPSLVRDRRSAANRLSKVFPTGSRAEERAVVRAQVRVERVARNSRRADDRRDQLRKIAGRNCCCQHGAIHGARLLFFESRILASQAQQVSMQIVKVTIFLALGKSSLHLAKTRGSEGSGRSA